MNIFPQKPKLKTMQRDGETFVCVDLESEKALQNQRILAMFVGSPAVVLGGMELKCPIQRAFLVGMGVACFYSHYSSYKLVSAQLKKLERKDLVRNRQI